MKNNDATFARYKELYPNLSKASIQELVKQEIQEDNFRLLNLVKITKTMEEFNPPKKKSKKRNKK